MDGYNGEHYRDKTAQRAIRRIEREDKERIGEAVQAVKRVLWLRGLELVGRITLQDIKTGRQFK